ncbi:hypothetical protein D3C80_2043550 [compost metagenome]
MLLYERTREPPAFLRVVARPETPDEHPVRIPVVRPYNYWIQPFGLAHRPPKRLAGKIDRLHFDQLAHDAWPSGAFS